MSYFDNDNDDKYMSDTSDTSDVEDIEDNDNDEQVEDFSDDEIEENYDMEGGAEGEAEEAEEEEGEGEEKEQVEKTIMTRDYEELDDDDEDDDPTGDQYLQKFEKNVNENYIMNFHPECKLHNYSEVIAMTKVVRDENNLIIDPLHKTIPFLTKYERARILGQRAKQINSGATAFIKVPENVIDGYVIAEMELQQKRIPFIIRRPLPNGGSEYWNLKDLEDISF